MVSSPGMTLSNLYPREGRDMSNLKETVVLIFLSADGSKKELSYNADWFNKSKHVISTEV